MVATTRNTIQITVKVSASPAQNTGMPNTKRPMTLTIFSTTAIRNSVPDRTYGTLTKMNSSICRRRDSGFASAISPPSQPARANRHPVTRDGAATIRPGRILPKRSAAAAALRPYASQLLVLRRQRLGLVVERLEYRIVLGHFGADRLEPLLQFRLVGRRQMHDLAATLQPHLA